MTLNVVVLYCWTVSLGELQGGKLMNSRMVVVRFTEQEASVPSMIAKVKDALESNEPLILKDHNGMEILDSEEELHLSNFIYLVSLQLTVALCLEDLI